MSQVQSVRVRSQRTAAAAVERARLTLVQTRPSSAPRAPFAVLVFVILVVGVVGLLMFNTHMQQASFYATSLQNKADAMQARSQALELKLEQLREPQRLGTAARALGMVAPPNPATINLGTGRIEGIPLPATPADGTNLHSALPPLPPALNPKPIHKTVKAATPTTPTTPTTSSGNAAKAPVTAKTQKTPAKTGGASHKTGTSPGTNNKH